VDRGSDLGLDSQKLITKLMGQRNQVRGLTSDPGTPILALLSNDDQLTEMVQGAAGSKWSVVKPGMAQISSLIREPNVKLVIFDDQSVAASDRGWALTEIRRCASRASIIYVAAEHDHANEKQARTRGVLFYTAKPLVPSDVNLLLQRLLQMQDGRRDLANRAPLARRERHSGGGHFRADFMNPISTG
jgi:DNA-binding NtrC family response regulator